MRNRLVPLALVMSLGLAPILGGCAVLAVGAAAILINEEFRDNAVTVIVQEDIDIVEYDDTDEEYEMIGSIEEDKGFPVASRLIQFVEPTLGLERTLSFAGRPTGGQT